MRKLIFLSAAIFCFLTHCGGGKGLYSLSAHTVTKAPPRSFKRCGSYTQKECSESLRIAGEVAARCSFREQAQCLMTFVETLHEVDDQAPFYGSVFNKMFRLGNVNAYKETYSKLSKRDRDTLRDLSAIVGIQAKEFFARKGQLTPERDHDLYDVAEERFEMYADKLYKKARPSEIAEFVDKVRRFGNHIQWPPEVKNVTIQ